MFLDLDQLRSFAVAADTLNFSEAGLRVGRVQSAISAQIRVLEETTGQSLFNRGRGKPMSLTLAGEKLLAHAHQMLRLNAAALSDLREESTRTAFSVGTTETYAISILPRVLSLFASRYPAVELTVICGSSPKLLELIEQRELDLAIITDQAKSEGRTLICADDLAWVAGPQMHVDAEAPLPLAFMPIGCEYRKRALTALDEMERSWRMAVNCLSPTGVRAALRADLAISVMPVRALEKDYRVLGKNEGLPELGEIRIAAYSHPEDTSSLVNGFISMAAKII
ncbi:MAG: LysR family transcriptional regulator [SAR86 cluster bacterium]|uniref:LysR family transcriptional regulator n=1 Tax=SAR86 cluster bacterium TaxID=2030880 RepID=A0A972VXS7_9GAMM|nr:LysR family transcriptional regulator [SAR86 cluster bacterium]